MGDWQPMVAITDNIDDFYCSIDNYDLEKLSSIEFADAPANDDAIIWDADKPGDNITGYYLGSINNTNSMHDEILHFILCQDNRKRIIKADYRLNTAFLDVEMGDAVKIVYYGVRMTKGFMRYRDFQVLKANNGRVQ